MANYVCLSHRWDSSSKLHTTTTTTLVSRKHGIELSSLPPTFQDAIVITRALGLQYIWIDCLCIIQDSKADWEEESAKMGAYYGSSWLTIAAGVESSQGLFGSRDISSDELQYWKVDHLQSDGSTLYFSDHDVGLTLGNEQESILQSRAWALQEELLSPRYHGFQEKQMYYRSGGYITFESGYKEHLHPLVGMIGISRDEGQIPLDPFLLQADNWFRDIVQDYSARNLTVKNDKLPALSGVAHEFQRVQGGHYLAGLWEKDLPFDLCWTTQYSPVPCRKPTKYRAPSWSWAAIDGRVSHADPRSNYLEREADVVHVSTELKGSDPMGEVVGGVLVICGILRRGIMSRMKAVGFGNSLKIAYDFHLIYMVEDLTARVPYTFRPDITDFSASSNDLWIMFLTPRTGLALLPVEGSRDQESPSTFERVGLISIKSNTPTELIPKNLNHEKFRTTISVI